MKYMLGTAIVMNALELVATAVLFIVRAHRSNK